MMTTQKKRSPIPANTFILPRKRVSFQSSCWFCCCLIVLEGTFESVFRAERMLLLLKMPRSLWVVSLLVGYPGSEDVVSAAVAAH